MIKIRIFRNIDGEIAGFAVNGHANTAPYGEDIVCAAVAAFDPNCRIGTRQHHLGRDCSLDIRCRQFDA